MLKFVLLGLGLAASGSAAMTKGFNQVLDAVVRIDVREVAFETAPSGFRPASVRA
jgi:hypothetical protein